MPIKAPPRESKFEQVPEGNHVARCYRVIHIGTVPETYLGEDREIDKVVIGFELPNETKVFKEGEAPKPYSIFKEYTVSMYERSNLYKFVTGMLGKAMTEEEAADFDISSLIGQTCLLNVIHEVGKVSGKERAVISGASPLPKGLVCPAAINDPQLLDYDNWDKELFESLPDFLKEKIISSKEYKAKINPTPVIDDSEIPF